MLKQIWGVFNTFAPRNFAPEYRDRDAFRQQQVSFN